MFRILFSLFSLCLVGCHLPAQMVWSPDGSKAAYRVGEKIVIIDSTGKVLSEPVTSFGGLAWRADSKAVYLASVVEAGKGPADVTFEVSSPATNASPADGTKVLISAWTDGGATEPLFTLPDRPVWHMAVSPDESWLAVIQANDQPNECALLAFHLPTRKLISISSLCGVAMCFTGPNRLAFIEPEDGEMTLKNAAGHVVEVLLSETASTIDRKKLINVRCDETAWIQPIGDDMLFTAAPMAYPSRASTARPTGAKLFHFSRADGGLCSIAEDVGPLFSISPDGKQILIEKLTANETKATRREIVMIRPNGSDARVLCDITSTPDLPMWPSWKSNTEIAFSAQLDTTQPIRIDGSNAVRFDVVLYRLTEMFDLQPVRTLSEGWPAELKPFYRVKPAAVPTTVPATQPGTTSQAAS